MGRVARYKKVKSVDPFAKGRTWTDDVGNTANIRRVKKRSKTAQKLKDQKNKRFRGQKKSEDDDGFDLPPGGEDEFDMSDLMGSVKRQKSKPDELLKGGNPILDNAVSKSSSSGNDKLLSSKPERIDARGIKQPSRVSKQPNSSNESKKNAAAVASSSGSKGLEITAYTSTREIIAACSNPKTQQQGVDGTNSKQAKRKAFFQQKKLKKKNKRARDDESEDDDVKNPDRDAMSAGKSSNQSRCAIDDQVERPPIFSALPRGAKKKKSAVTKKNEGQDEKADRIRKEQQNLEAMRQHVMAQYAILRESRRR